MQYGCIGEHLGHSFSAPIHGMLGDYPYEIREIPREELDAFLDARDFLGINVTIPYKEKVIPHLDEISPLAGEIGAVNTVVNRGGRLYGYNTDYDGMQALLERIGVPLAGKKVAVLGSGGTSRTACVLANRLGASHVLCVGRQKKEGCITYEELYACHGDAEYIINTTPCGMYPYDDGKEGMQACPVDLARLPGVAGVADAVYNPLRTELVSEAIARGIPASGGLYMLVAQAVKASELFLNTAYPASVLDDVMKKMTGEKENIVLTGMPGSGKSTVGRLLAEDMGRPFLDTDALIVEAAGMAIPEIFAQKGEAYFRDLEADVIRDRVSQMQGAVIATGGGVILREENLRRLRRNGRIFFLDRPLKDLIPTQDRPLSATKEDIVRRYEERYDRYCNTADVHLPISGNARETAAQIESEWNK